MANKFTQEEFDNHYKEFLMNPSKYQSMDLNFKMSMLMRGCSDDEFDSKIDNRGSSDDTWCNYSDMPSPKAYEHTNEPWVDNEDGDEQDDYSSSKLKRYGGGDNDVGDDSNEY